MTVRTKYEAADIRKILTGMIVDRSVCARISSQWQSSGLFAQPWANAVGGMVVNHYKKYGEPPARCMPSIFEDWAKTTVYPEQEITAVEHFIAAMSDERHQDAPEYILDLAGKHFNKVELERMLEAAGDDLKHYDVDAAEQKLEKRKRINLGVGAIGKPAASPDRWIAAYSTERATPMFRYRGPLGEFIGDAFQRGRLFSFMAPDKVGKTAWLIDAAYMAVRERCRVAYFDTGDGVEDEFLRRLGARASRRPLVSGMYKMPIASEGVTWGDELAFSEYHLEGHDGIEACRAFRDVCQSDETLWTSFHGAGSLSALDLEALLADWDKSHDWRPDVVVIDYADILAPPSGVKDTLDQIDETWKTLHRIAQQRHCLVLTATQASALAYGKEDGLLSKKHFSGRKTKLAHVDGMLGINVTPDEKDRGMARINWIVRRAAAYNERHFCRVAGSMAIGNPAILSKKG